MRWAGFAPAAPPLAPRRGLAALAFALAFALGSAELGSISSLAQQQPTTPSPSGKLSGKAAIEALIGNTMTGNADGAPYFAFYAKDGTVTMKRSGETTSGKWSIAGDDLCEEYPDDEDESCYKLELDGMQGLMTDEDGTPYKVEILPGNPEKL